MIPPALLSLNEQLVHSRSSAVVGTCESLCKPGSGADAELLKQVGDLLTDHGQVDLAERVYRRGLELDDESVPLLNNIALLFEVTGRPNEALDYYQVAAELDPRNAGVQANLANAYVTLGRRQSALDHYKRAISLAPLNNGFLYNYALLLASSSCTAYDAGLEADLASMLRSPLIDHDELAPLVGTLLSLKPSIRAALHQLRGGSFALTLNSLSHDEFLVEAFTRCVIPHQDVEALLVLTRDGLARYLEDSGSFSPEMIRLALAVAIQANRAGHVWAEAERYDLAIGQDALSLEEASIILGYGELSPAILRKARDALSKAVNNPLAKLALKLFFENPETEEEIRDLIMSTTTGHLELMAEYYDHNPYPRWTSCFKFQPISAYPYFSELAGGKPLSWQSGEKPRILIAGCGTGKHALSIAQRFDDVEVVAIDIAPRSLAHAIRRQTELGVTNVKFLLRDLTQGSPDLGLFDVIESVGVLHHLDDPEAGLAALREHLKPRGLIKLGLYSELARKPIAQFSASYRSPNETATLDQVRTGRAAIRALPQSSQLRATLASSDFYSLSSCRDLLFNPRERLYTLPSIVELATSNRLFYLSVDIPIEEQRRLADFVLRTPTLANRCPLEQWYAFEQSFPMTFAGMYQVWFQG